MKIKFIVLSLFIASLCFGLTQKQVKNLTGYPGGLRVSNVITIDPTEFGGTGALAVNATSLGLSGTLTGVTTLNVDEIETTRIQAKDASGIIFTNSANTTVMIAEDGGGLAVDTDTLVVDAANNRVGVNDATPATTLEVVGGINSILRLTDSAAAGRYTEFGSSTITMNRSSGSGTTMKITTAVNGGTWASTGGHIDFSPSDNFVMRVDRNGNVGIGETDPSTKLEVAGTVSASALQVNGNSLTAHVNADDIVAYENGNAGMTLFSSATGVGTIYFGDGDSGSSMRMGGIQYDHSADKLNLYSNSNVGLYLDSSSGANFAGDVTVVGDTIIATKTPASAAAAGTAGMIAWDADYIYICTATNTWERVAIASW